MRVELGARVTAHLGDRDRARERVAVGAIRGHRVVRVAAEDDPRLDRDLVAGEPVGIATPVEALVRAADDLADVAHEPADSREHPLALDRVRTNHLPLGLVERARLVDDLLGDRDLADVV